MDFIYLGETHVGKDEFESFMMAAEKLKVDGLVHKSDGPHITKQAFPDKENTNVAFENEVKQILRNKTIENAFEPKQEGIHIIDDDLEENDASVSLSEQMDSGSPSQTAQIAVADV